MDPSFSIALPDTPGTMERFKIQHLDCVMSPALTSDREIFLLLSDTFVIIKASRSPDISKARSCRTAL